MLMQHKPGSPLKDSRVDASSSDTLVNPAKYTSLVKPVTINPHCLSCKPVANHTVHSAQHNSVLSSKGRC